MIVLEVVGLVFAVVDVVVVVIEARVEAVCVGAGVVVDVVVVVGGAQGPGKVHCPLGWQTTALPPSISKPTCVHPTVRVAPTLKFTLGEVKK